MAPSGHSRRSGDGADRGAARTEGHTLGVRGTAHRNVEAQSRAQSRIPRTRRTGTWWTRSWRRDGDPVKPSAGVRNAAARRQRRRRRAEHADRPQPGRARSHCGDARAAAARRRDHHRRDRRACDLHRRARRTKRRHRRQERQPQVAGTEVSTKTRWDKAVLRQEFSTATSKLTKAWDVDVDGRLVLVARVESLRLRTPEQKAVFDKK